MLQGCLQKKQTLRPKKVVIEPQTTAYQVTTPVVIIPQTVVIEPQTVAHCATRGYHATRGLIAPHPPDDNQYSGILGSTVSSAPFFYRLILLDILYKIHTNILRVYNSFIS
jgi:hypothetical protein